MTTLADKIENYYFNHFTTLAKDKQFHFATRLAAWSNNPRAEALLRTQIDEIYTIDIRRTLKEMTLHPPHAKVNAAALRQPYFEKYPELRGRMLSLFRVRHLLSVYDVDARKDMLSITPIEDLQNLCTALIDDTAALRVLSTYAVNYIYLVRHILYPTAESDKQIRELAATIYNLGDYYDVSKKEDIQLLIYLYTHCIIGHSNFYKDSIDQKTMAVYLRMIDRLEQLIENNFNKVNLDNKFEFLVCARILEKTSKLNDAIVHEAAQSLSPDGTFVIDTINDYRQSNKTSFSDSEHRNVLFIMSQRPYHSSDSVQQSRVSAA